MRSAVVLVDDRIYFDDLEAEHAAVVGKDLHGEMRFAIGSAAAHGSADAGGVFGVDPVHVERDVIAGRAAARSAKGFFHHGAHAALVDVAHGVDLGDAGSLDVFFFRGVDVAHADQHDIVRVRLWARSRRMFGEFFWGRGRAARPAACRGRCREGDVSGVLMSEWASIQSRPTFCCLRR